MSNAREMLDGIDYAEDPYACAKGADALVIVTEWDAFRALDLDRVKKTLEAALTRRPTEHLRSGRHKPARIQLMLVSGGEADSVQ